MRADKIVVLQKGSVVESGTHEELLAKEGAYAGLVLAQTLSLGEESEDLIEEKDGALLDREQSVAKSEKAPSVKPIWKRRGLFTSFGSLLFELKPRWPLFILMLIFAACASGKARGISICF